MALINCPKCGKSVSEKAVRCPHCGATMRNMKVSSKSDINIKKLLIGVVVFLGGIMSIVPLFYDIYGVFSNWYFDDTNNYMIDTPPFFGIPTIESYFAIAVGVIGGVTCLTLCTLGIIRFNKGIKTTWRYWILAVVFSVVSAFGTFVLFTISDNAKMNALHEKIASAKGTYEFTNSEGGTSIIFSMCEDGLVKIKEQEDSEGKVSLGYDCRHNFFDICFNYRGYTYSFTADFDMTNIIGKDPLSPMPLHKISDDVFIFNNTDAETSATSPSPSNERKKNKEIENLHSFALSALMLHGKVKSVEESLGGNACTVYKFTKSGDLENIYQDNYRGKSWHRNKELVISFENTDDEYGGWAYSYTVDDKGRLVKSMYSSGDFAEEVNYSNYNSNGWPTRSKTVAEFGGDVTICSLNYSQIDEHGNWTQQHSVDDSGNESDVYRSIEYYK